MEEIENNPKIHKVRTIILLIIFIAIAGMVLYGENPNFSEKENPPSFKNLINSLKQ